jgi:hypothetical protein
MKYHSEAIFRGANGSEPDYLTMKEVLGGASSNGYGSYRRRNGTGIEGHQLGG